MRGSNITCLWRSPKGPPTLGNSEPCKPVYKLSVTFDFPFLFSMWFSIIEDAISKPHIQFSINPLTLKPSSLNTPNTLNTLYTLNILNTLSPKRTTTCLPYIRAFQGRAVKLLRLSSSTMQLIMSLGTSTQ